MSRDGRRATRLAIGILFALGWMLACSSLSGRQPEPGQSADQHEQHAREHEAKAREHEEHYDPDVSVEVTRGTSYGREDQDKYSISDYNWGERRYNPTERHLEHAERHERHAAAHTQAAKELRQFEEQQCSAFPAETRPYCPLIGQIVSMEEIPHGVRLFFAERVNVDAAAAHIRCHLAFARTQGFQGMQSCPLYTPRLRMRGPSQQGRDGWVELVVDSGGDVETLRALVAEHIVGN